MYPALNILLTLVWAGLLGSFSLASLVSGFVVSYGLLYLVTRGLPGHPKYFGKVPRLIGFTNPAARIGHLHPQARER